MAPEQKWVIVACVVALVLSLNASVFVFFMQDKYLVAVDVVAACETSFALFNFRG
jgi:hypothetical protein